MRFEGLDETDSRILAVIENDARLSYSEIGEKVGLSRVSVRNRMESLEKRGVILGYCTRIDPSFIREEATMEQEGLYRRTKEILGRYCGDLSGFSNVVKFPVYFTKSFSEADIDLLDLSVRSANALRRAGMQTVGQLCERIDRREDLLKLRNCGMKSAAEIMDHLFAFQYGLLKPEKQEEFIERVKDLNR